MNAQESLYEYSLQNASEEIKPTFYSPINISDFATTNPKLYAMFDIQVKKKETLLRENQQIYCELDGLQMSQYQQEAAQLEQAIANLNDKKKRALKVIKESDPNLDPDF